MTAATSPASGSRGAGRRARQAMLAGVTVLVLAGCGLLGTASEREPEWAKDPDSGKYYRPGVVLPSQDLLEEHFPTLEGVQEATLADGRFTDPEEQISPCSSGWIEVEDALAHGGYEHRTAAGDMIQLAALCEDTAELVIAANDM